MPHANVAAAPPLESLFTEFPLPLPASPADAAPRPRGPFAGVAIEKSLDGVLDYSIPARLAASIKVGQRVRVPLGRGNRPSHGYVVSIHATSDYPKIKDLFAI